MRVAGRVFGFLPLAALWVCLVSGPSAHAFLIRVSPEGAAKLVILNQALAPIASEFQIKCEPEVKSGQTLCDLKVFEKGEAEILEELIGNPLDPRELIAYRITQGSPAFRESLYEATGLMSETRIYAASVLERRLDLEESQFRIRCIKEITKPEAPLHHCWVIVGTSLFAEKIE
jgi:hypothetical protein